MAQLLYGSPPTVFELDDRTLAHLELVTLAKLRRNESFALSLDTGETGRTTIWVGIHSALQFVFDEREHPINRVWLDQLMDSANTTAGMHLVPEAAPPGS